jgi:hypothetical protein
MRIEMSNHRLKSALGHYGVAVEQADEVSRTARKAKVDGSRVAQVGAGLNNYRLRVLIHNYHCASVGGTVVNYHHFKVTSRPPYGKALEA